MEPMLSVTEAARLLGVTRSSIHKWIKAGRLQVERVHPNLFLIQRGEVERFKAEDNYPSPPGWRKKGRPRISAQVAA